MTDTDPAAGAACPCSSGSDRSACCGPYLSGEARPPTAEALMRSRYSAYVEGAIPYLMATIHPLARDEEDEEEARRWSRKSEWLGLEVTEVEEGGEDDARGEVEFVARYVTDGREVAHHERATFLREKGRWYFASGETPGPETFVREGPRVGRNDPCPCGSGKKHKKCCG